jgi:plasmid stabilization system protein ParE
VKVLWTDSAIAQLQAIHDYVAQTSSDYAVAIVDRLTRRSIQIAAFPNPVEWCPSTSGRKFVKLSKDGIIYLIEVAQVQVLAVIHGARDLQP